MAQYCRKIDEFNSKASICSTVTFSPSSATFHRFTLHSICLAPLFKPLRCVHSHYDDDFRLSFSFFGSSKNCWRSVNSKQKLILEKQVLQFPGERFRMREKLKWKFRSLCMDSSFLLTSHKLLFIERRIRNKNEERKTKKSHISSQSTLFAPLIRACLVCGCAWDDYAEEKQIRL